MAGDNKVTLKGKQVLNEGAVRKGGVNIITDVSKPALTPVAQQRDSQASKPSSSDSKK